MNAKNTERAKEIGARITEARNAAGMKQRELAELIGVSERSIQAYEQGETIPWRFGNDLERIFNRPLAWFWYGRDELSGNSDNLLHTLVDEVRSLRSYIEGELIELRAEVGRLSSNSPATHPRP